MASETEWAWVAGIIEGEGYFDMRRNGVGKNYLGAAIRVRMTDLDVLQKLLEVAGVGNIGGPYIRPAPRKPIWEWRIHSKSGVKEVLKNTVKWYGKRRGDRAREMIEALPDDIHIPVDQVRMLAEHGESQRKLARKYGCSQATIHRIIHFNHSGVISGPLCSALPSRVAARA